MATVQSTAAKIPAHSGVGCASVLSKEIGTVQTKKAVKRNVKVLDLPLSDPKSKHPSERLPEWAKPMPNEDTAKYAERLGFAIHQDSLERSLRGDTAAHAKWREQAMKGLGLGQRTELDITAKHEDWTRYLTDEQLRSLVSLQKEAQAKMLAPQNGDNTEISQSIPNTIETKVSQTD